jgi:hypothetical protein
VATDRLTADELTRLIRRVFRPTSEDRSLALIVDLPDDEVPDNERWHARRDIAAGWYTELQIASADLGIETALFLYRNVHSNNADLPEAAWAWDASPVPDDVDGVGGRRQTTFESIFSTHRLVLAPTEFSTTAPLKVLAPRYGFRAATMPGFSDAMVPALRLDYGEVNHRVDLLKGLLDAATGADFSFVVEGFGECALHLDLRHRTAHASGGLLPSPGTAGNLPSGEAYIVPYEGERDGEPSVSAGHLPIQLGDEAVVFAIEGNRAIDIVSTGPTSSEEARRLAAEPARGNVAELGLGVLADFGVTPIGEVLLDEKLGLHLAFGRSEHFGGQVGPKDFSAPAAVMHQDHVYLREIQPLITARLATLEMADGSRVELIRDGDYVIDFSRRD